MNRHKSSIVLLAALFMSIVSSPSFGWTHHDVEDGQIVERSKLILIARLDPGSIRRVEHDAPPGQGRSHHHTATLLVTSALKGEAPKTIDIIIRYGLTPTVTDAAAAPRAITMEHTGSRASMLTDDLAKDQIWFLHGENYRTPPAADVLSVEDPEDIQPIALREYFAAHLDPDPEAKVLKFFVNDPAVRSRAQRYLAACELRRIAADPDPARRAIRTLPHLLSRTESHYKPSMTDVMLSCGDAGGAALESVFDAWHQRQHRSGILRIWSKLKYRPAVPRIVASVAQSNKWFEAQLEAGLIVPGKFEHKGDGADNYSTTYYGIAALRGIGDTSAVDTVQTSRDLWSRISVGSKHQIVEECDGYLKQAAAASTKPQ